jgi:hypothetical protein
VAGKGRALGPEKRGAVSLKKKTKSFQNLAAHKRKRSKEKTSKTQSRNRNSSTVFSYNKKR